MYSLWNRSTIDYVAFYSCDYIKDEDKYIKVVEDSVEMLEDLITQAMNQATADAQKKMKDKMKGIAPAGLNIPGLF